MFWKKSFLLSIIHSFIPLIILWDCSLWRLKNIRIFRNWPSHHWFRSRSYLVNSSDLLSIWRRNNNFGAEIQCIDYWVPKNDSKFRLWYFFPFNPPKKLQLNFLVKLRIWDYVLFSALFSHILNPDNVFQRNEKSSFWLGKWL